jgi:hypothetical protein
MNEWMNEWMEWMNHLIKPTFQSSKTILLTNCLFRNNSTRVSLTENLCFRPVSIEMTNQLNILLLINWLRRITLCHSFQTWGWKIVSNNIQIFNIAIYIVCTFPIVIYSNSTLSTSIFYLNLSEILFKLQLYLHTYNSEDHRHLWSKVYMCVTSICKAPWTKLFKFQISYHMFNANSIIYCLLILVLQYYICIYINVLIYWIRGNSYLVTITQC